MKPFIGREQELKLLEGLLIKKTASLAVVYGRRRIGKSRIIEYFARKYKFISFSGLYPDKHTTAEDQLKEFYLRFTEQFPDSAQPPFTDWSKAFHALAEKCRKGRVIILLDEISWMSHQAPNFLGKLKNIWDLEFKKNNELILILCGSVATWIEKNIISHKGFYGRISLKLFLKELSLNDSNQFWNSGGSVISAFEKYKCLSVAGGIPKYLEELRIDQSADENIKRLCFSRSGLLFNDYDYIFTSLLEKESHRYQQIINLLSTGKLQRSEVSETLQISTGKTLSEYLNDLVISGFLSRDYAWDLKSGEPAKLSRYRLVDNYLRFYLKYIKPNLAKIERDQFAAHSSQTLPGWATIMGLQFENLILNNRHLILQKLNIYPDEVINDGPFFQSTTKRHPGCQIDYLIQTKSDVLYLCEIKFTRTLIRESICEDIRQKIKALALPKHCSIKPVLIYLGDIHDNVLDSNYFIKVIDAGEFLESR